jgi:hypothetical protein
MSDNDFNIGDLVWVNIIPDRDELALVLRFIQHIHLDRKPRSAVVLIINEWQEPIEALVPFSKMRLVPPSKEITDEDR